MVSKNRFKILIKNFLKDQLIDNSKNIDEAVFIGYYEIYRIISPSEKTYYGRHYNKNYPIDDGYMGTGKFIKKSIKKHGIEKHKKEILFITKNIDIAFKVEIFVIKTARENKENCMNILDGGIGFTKGNIISEKTRKAVAKANKERIYTEELRAKLRARKRPIFTKDTIQKLVIANKGRKITWADKISKTLMGHKRSEESKNKQRETMKGQHRYNNGKINIKANECPKGFILGRLMPWQRKKHA